MTIFANYMKKHFSGIFLMFVSGLFLFAPTIVGAFNSPASGTLSVSSTSVNVGDQITITITGYDNDGLYSLQAEYQGRWYEQKVYSTVATTKTWTVTEQSPAIYKYCGMVVGYNPESGILSRGKEYVKTVPNCINVNVSFSSQLSQNYLSCYDNDLYWYTPQGTIWGKYQECGNDYCNDWGSNYCSGNNVYRYRTCYRRGCSLNSCYNNSYTETQLIQTCGANQTCQNGQCSNQTAYECSTGPCCDGRYYKLATTSCNFEIQTEYGCPWGSILGADVGKRTRTRLQYCSGTSSQCNGNLGDWLTWTNWIISDYCSNNEFCVAGNSQCQTRTTTVQPLSSSYIKYFSKSCYDNDLYWVDSRGERQDKYQECSDNNECTLDECQNQKCVNELKCDGTTCKTGSEEYCKSCNHCGDGICNCGETVSSCASDCKSGILTITILGKKEGDFLQWLKNLDLRSGENIDFLFVVKNNGENKIENVIVKAEMPEEIIYSGNLKIDGNSSAGDIKDGINLGSLDPNTVKTITFKGKIKPVNLEEGEKEIVGKVNAGEFSDSDSLKINIKTSRGVAAVGLGAIKFFVQQWYFWLLVILVLAYLFYMIFRSLFSVLA